jgi:uncharacterized integral membrane protein
MVRRRGADKSGLLANSAVILLHLIGGIAFILLFWLLVLDKGDTDLTKWQMVGVSFAAFPAAIVSALWIVVGYPVSLVATLARIFQRHPDSA